MCRIAGLISKESIKDFYPVQRMLDAMKRGGPDDTGIFTSGKVCFGHNRLSIIELSNSGHQPMKSLDENVIISFNGEIYNFQIIRSKLQRLGHLFRSNSDTEVIIKAYENWGLKAIGMFEGIFAFAIYDKRIDKVFLVRDFPGVKPLYYSLSDQELVFCSEVKAFQAFKGDWKINKNWEIYFLAFGFMPFPFTTIDGLVELSPGTVLELDLTSFKSKEHVFYKRGNHKPIVTKEENALNIIHEKVQNALSKNLVSDASIGIFLSGGLDSSILALLADKKLSKIKTISVNFDEKDFDEYKYQSEVLLKSRHLEHTYHRVSKDMFFEGLNGYWEALDQPTVDGINAFFISKCAQAEGQKVVLSGIGADEVLGGYTSNRKLFIMNLLKRLPFKRNIAAFLATYKNSYSRIKFLELDSWVGDYLFLRGVYTTDEIARLTNITEQEIIKILNDLAPIFEFDRDSRNYVPTLEYDVYMRNQLLRDFDTMGMWHGIEIRVPFLDIELLKSISQISDVLVFKGNKFLLRQAFRNLIPSVLLKRKKKGFTFPFQLWLKESISEIDSLVVNDDNYVEIRNDFLTGQSHWSKFWVYSVSRKFRDLKGMEPSIENNLFKSINSSL
jgi:asparagine synthase (glutamine-hydrolysing)